MIEALVRSSQISRRHDDMHFKSGISHEGNVDSVSRRSGRIRTGIILSNECTVADRHTDGHWLEIPVRSPAPYAGKSVFCSQRSTQKIVIMIPVTEVTAKEHREDGLRAFRCKVG